MAQIQPKLHNCVERGFPGKNYQNYYFQSIMFHHAKIFKKKLCDRLWDITLNNFWTNWAQILLLLEKGIFWENWLTVSQKYWQIISYKVLKFWAKLDTNYPFTPKANFFEKLTLIFVCFRYPIKIIQCFKTIAKVDYNVQGWIIFG